MCTPQCVTLTRLPNGGRTCAVWRCWARSMAISNFARLDRMVTRTVDRDLGYSGSWAFRFDPSDRGTLITITESGDISNPVFKFLARYIFGHTASIDAYLKALAKHFGESAMPQNAEHPTG